MLQGLAEEYHFQILAMEVMPDPNFVKEIWQIAVPMAPNYDLDKIYETYHTLK